MPDFFSVPEFNRSLLAASAILTRDESRTASYRLGLMLGVIATTSAEFDKRCPFTIEDLGEVMRNRVKGVSGAISDSDINALSSYVYRLFIELDLSRKPNVSREMKNFMEALESNADLEAEPRANIDYAKNKLPFEILKNIVNADEFVSLREVSKISDATSAKIDVWERRIEELDKRAIDLSNVLANHVSEINFVALSAGFKQLASKISAELKMARYVMWVMGAILLLPAAIDLWAIMSGIIDFGQKQIYTGIGVIFSSLAVTLLLLYFFRIALRKVDSSRAQLIQVELRLTLCQFIQDYAVYSAEIKSKNPDALAKFEALIFSGIVGTEDKLPSTFDGLEQMGLFAKNIVGK